MRKTKFFSPFTARITSYNVCYTKLLRNCKRFPILLCYKCRAQCSCHNRNSRFCFNALTKFSFNTCVWKDARITSYNVCYTKLLRNGINLIAITDGVPSIIKLSFISFLLGWAGTSVHFQTAEILSETDIEIKPYLIGKLFHGLFSAIYTAILGLLLNLV